MLKYSFFILFVPFFMAASLHAQTGEWLIGGGGFKSDKATTIVVVDAGNGYVTGYYNEKAFFGPFATGFSFQNSKEVFVAKIDPDGNWRRVRSGGSADFDRGADVDCDTACNVYVTGYFSQIFHFEDFYKVTITSRFGSIEEKSGFITVIR